MLNRISKIVLCVLIFASSSVFADTAETYYEQANEAFRTKDYTRAISLWRQSYDLAPKPILLYNIAVAHGKTGNIQEAIRNAELAELQGLSGENAVKNRSRIIAFRTAISAQTVKPSEVQVREIVRPPERTEPPSNAGWVVIGATSLGLSAIAGVTAIIINDQLQDPISRFETAQQRNDPSGNAILKDEIEPKQTVGRIMMISSGVLGVAGAAMLLYALLSDSGSDEPVSMTPTGVMVRY